MSEELVFIGFGEAAQAFAGAGIGNGMSRRAYDIKTESESERAAKRADYRRLGVRGCNDPDEALSGGHSVLSLVTADQALAAARQGAGRLGAGAYWFDMNSVAPDTKRAAADAVEASGGIYIDVAVMAPVHPACLDVPLLVSAPHAEEGAAILRALGFSSVRVGGDRVGDAAAVKMIRSVMVKGIEALTAEALLAAETVGVRDEVLASLDASWPGAGWAARADHSLDRMMRHGFRRAAEMEEVVKMLDALGTGSGCSRATAERQRSLGALRLAPSETLGAKLAALLAHTGARSA